MDASSIHAYFPKLTDAQLAQLSKLPEVYAEWNAKVNVISRKDMEHFMERHVLHSLALSYYFSPQKGDKILDIGTGGGFPGIPLAIMYPEVSFVLVDSIGKKVKVVAEVVEAIGLNNVIAVHGRAEDMAGRYNYAVTRAVARLSNLVVWCRRPKLIIPALYCLKGGDLREEVEEIDAFPSTVYKIEDKLKEPFFETKKVVYVQLR